jgi:1-acyl-sn-glycerol-3-phosphate acyltransferase
MRPYWRFVRATVGVLMRAAFGIEARGISNIPTSGGCLIAANHISLWDPPLLGASASREVWFLAKHDLFAIPIFGSIIRLHNAIPIKRGLSDKEGLSRAIRLVESGRALAIFPEGGRSIPGVFRPPKAGVGTISLEAGGAPIVPAYIQGTRPIRGAILRRVQPSITFGEPIWPHEVAELATNDQRTRARVLARIVMDHIAAIRDRPL